MSQQRSYEGYAYPTEFQSGIGGGGGDTYFSAARPASSTPAYPAGGAGGLASTGLTRRSNQHAGGAGTAGGFPAANPSASPAAVAMPSNTAYGGGGGGGGGGYNYFHGHGNSFDVNSGYNSDVGSSVSNPRMAVNVSSGYQPGGAGGMVAPEVSPLRPPQPPRFESSRHASAVPGIAAPSVTVGVSSSAGGVFRGGGSDGRPDSAADSGRSSTAARPPAFLPSRPFVQTSPSPAQPYAVPMPSAMHAAPGSHDPLGGVGPGEFGSAPRMAHMVSPSTAGPRMPTPTGEYGQPGSAGGGGGGARAGGGIFGRLLAQVVPAFDDGVVGGVPPGFAADGGVGGPPGERPPHQLRFGNPADDLPLLEELGIFPRHILDKARAVLNPFKTMSAEAAKDTDLAGPILFALSLAVLLSMRGKIQFSAIYGLFVLGVAFFKVLLSLMQPKSGGAPLQFVVSTVGYGLLPTVLLAVVRNACLWLLTRRSLLPLTLLMIVWSAWCGSVLVAKGLGMDEQRYLVLYPMLLFYAAFDALTVF